MLKWDLQASAVVDNWALQCCYFYREKIIGSVFKKILTKYTTS